MRDIRNSRTATGAAFVSSNLFESAVMNCFYHRCGARMMSVSDHAGIAGSAPFAATISVMIRPVFSSTLLHRVRIILRTISTLMATAVMPAFAMELKVSADALVLSGEVVARDLDRIKDVLRQNANITHVVLRNSMGGNSWTGYRLGELFREKGMITAVSGYCVSSCSRLFLGGKVRMFSDDYPASLTYVGFHGHYDFGKLNLAAVRKDDLAGWTKKYTDGKVDAKLMQRWINIERRAGDVRFYPDPVAERLTQPTVLCAGTESARPQQCEKIATHALAQGIVTTNALYSSPDASGLPYKIREQRFPTTAYAMLAQTDRLPTRSPAARRDFDQFKNAALPRAFAVSASGQHWAWSANDARSPEEALSRCKTRAASVVTGAKCSLYAVDDRIVYNAK